MVRLQPMTMCLFMEIMMARKLSDVVKNKMCHPINLSKERIQTQFIINEKKRLLK